MILPTVRINENVSAFETTFDCLSIPRKKKKSAFLTLSVKHKNTQ